MCLLHGTDTYRRWNLVFWPCHDSGGYLLEFQHGGPVSIRGRSPCHLWQTEWQCDRFLSEYIGFPLSASFHQCSILISNHMLLLPERKSDEVWEPSQNQPYFGNPWTMGRKVLLCFSYLNNWDTFEYGLSCSFNAQQYLDRMEISGWGLCISQQFINARTPEPRSWLCPSSIKI